jgi:hypothetical protein
MNAMCLANKFYLLQGNLSKFYKILERNACLVLMIATFLLLHHEKEEKEQVFVVAGGLQN